MMALSIQQSAALTVLRDGPRNTLLIAEAIRLAFHTCSWMLNTLRERGYVACSRVRDAGKSRFVWRLTAAGARVVNDNAAAA